LNWFSAFISGGKAGTLLLPELDPAPFSELLPELLPLPDALSPPKPEGDERPPPAEEPHPSVAIRAIAIHGAA
jgi:hypothetical protein